MGNLCSKRAAVSDDTKWLSEPASNTDRGVLPVTSADLASSAPLSTSSNSLLGHTAARSCATSVCSRLQCIFAPVIDSLDQQLAANNAALTWPALQLVQLQAFICKNLTAGDAPETVSNLLAVLYTLALAAPTAVAGTVVTHSPAINRLTGILSIVLSNQDVTGAAESWRQWQQLADAVGFHPRYSSVVLTPASKAVLLQLEAAAKSASVRTVRLQVHRTLVFADACATLLLKEPSQLSAGPCVIGPVFLPSSPDNTSSQSSSSHSMQPASHAHSIQAISHASTSNAWQSDVNRQSSSGCGCVAEEEAHAAAVGSDADVSDGSPVLREEGEGRGPRKEFFAAVGAGISAGNSTEALFVYNHSAACYWYNTQQSPTGHRQQQYRVAGWLAGQALHNRAPLGIPLAPLLWQKATLQTLQDFDPVMGQTLRRVLQSGGPDLAALLQLEGLSQGTSAEAYVQAAVQQICVEDVVWQFTSFAQGFCAAVSLDLLQRYLVTPIDLAEMVSGSSNSWRNVDAIQHVFHVVQDRQLQQEYATLSKCLWEVVNGWDMELKQQFVLFVTGSRRLPQPHTELLQVQLPFVAFDRRDHANMLSRLPQVPADASPYAM
ncbi:hypothetical protein ABBQ38_011331 [Trebouxia sp. C0009 RCD-2024]